MHSSSKTNLTECASPPAGGGGGLLLLLTPAPAGGGGGLATRRGELNYSLAATLLFIDLLGFV